MIAPAGSAPPGSPRPTICSSSARIPTADDLQQLRHGSRSDAVRQLQEDLKDLGYYKGTVSGHYGSSAYSVTVYEQSKVYHKDIDMSADNYLREFERFAHMVRSGKMIMSYEELIKPVFILNAIHKSMQTGEMVKVNQFEI